MLIDTHSHIYSEEYNGEVDEIVKNSIAQGVEKIILPNIDSSSIKRMVDLSERFPENCFPMMGLHPTSVNDDFEEELEVVEFWLEKRKFWGIGEIGIDLYWDNSYLEEQQYIFKRQLKLAKQYNLPLSIHIRNSFDEVFSILKDQYDSSIRGVFHSFTGTAEQAKAVIEMGFKIGVGGIVTFKNAGIDEMVAKLSPHHIILETDSPYLSPAPLRGKRNESANIIYIAKKVAEIFNTTKEDISSITTQNAIRLFNLP